MTLTEIMEYIEKKGTTDKERDVNTLKRLTNNTTKKRLERYVINLTNAKLKLSTNPKTGCYASNNNGVILINIDPLMAFSIGDSFEKCFIRMQGFAAHEAGHLLYSDYEEFGKIGMQSQLAKLSVPKIAAGIDKTDTSFHEDLYNAIFNYIYTDKMTKMVNSLEDGAIENAMSRDFERTYGPIVSARNHIWEMESEVLEQANFTSLDTVQQIDMLITEIRALCVIGYRRHVEPKLLASFLDKKDVELIKWYTLYARLGAKSTLERAAMADACLEYFKPFFEKKAREFYDKYMEALSMDAEDLLNGMTANLNQHSEFAVNGYVDSSIIPPSSGNHTSDYDLDLPDDVNKKIQDKINERMESNENQSGQSGQNGQNDKQTEQEGQNGQQDCQSGQQEGQNNQQSSTGDESSKDKNNDGTNGESNLTESKSGTSKSGTAFDNDSVAAAAAEAEQAVNESIKKLESERELIDGNSFNKEVTGGCGKAPTLSNKLSDPSVLSNIHDGVNTLYYPPNTFRDKSYEGQEASNNEDSLRKQGDLFSKKIKELLMYMSKNRIQSGLRQGKIKQSSLYRAKTDARVFSKKIEGIENKARFCVLIDQSGSMSGDKMIDAIQGAYVLTEACQKINVPISVFGHNTKNNACSLYHYVDFEHFKSKEYKEKLFAASSGYSNHDGLALFHSLCDLVRHSKDNEKLIMIVISDGAPAGLKQYWGELADKDIQMTYQKFEKEYNVKTIGVGIGDDVEHVPNIYKNYVLVPNVDELSNELLKIMKDILIKN